MTWVNMGCGPFRAPTPWVNYDCWRDDQIRPDIVVDAEAPWAEFDDESVDAVYCGHVIEHVPWPDVEGFLNETHRVLRPGGVAMFVAPDVLQAIRRWKDGLDPEGFELVEALIESPWEREHANGYGVLRQHPAWPGSRHWWNCWADRLQFAFEQSAFEKAESVPITESALRGWPVVAHTQWQCAVKATKDGSSEGLRLPG